MTTSAALKAAATRRARKAPLVVYSKTMTRTDMVALDMKRLGYPPLKVEQAQGDAPGRVRVAEGVTLTVPANGAMTLSRTRGGKTVEEVKLGEKTVGLLDALDVALFSQFAASVGV